MVANLNRNGEACATDSLTRAQAEDAERPEVVPSSMAGFGETALSVCGLIDDTVYALGLIESLPPSPRTLCNICESRAAWR